MPEVPYPLERIPPPVPQTTGGSFNLGLEAANLGDLLAGGGAQSNEIAAAQIIDTAARALMEAGKMVPRLAPILIGTLKDLQRALTNMASPAAALEQLSGPEDLKLKDRIGREVEPPQGPPVGLRGKVATTAADESPWRIP